MPLHARHSKLSYCQRLNNILLGALFIFSWAKPSHANDYLKWQSPEYILQAFQEIALKNEYKQPEGKVLKWQAPIHYQFEYYSLSKNNQVETLFDIHFKQLSSITNHPVKRTSQNPNLTIHLTTDALYDQVINQQTPSMVSDLATQSHCMGSFQTNHRHEIIKATIVLPVDHVFSRGLLVACIVEESTQIMGLPNDSDWVYPSIANDVSKIELLSGLDYILLKILYHPSLQAGLTKTQSRPKIKRIIDELELSQEIKQAAKKVNQSGLYPLIN